MSNKKIKAIVVKYSGKISVETDGPFDAAFVKESYSNWSTAGNEEKSPEQMSRAFCSCRFVLITL